MAISTLPNFVFGIFLLILTSSHGQDFVSVDRSEHLLFMGSDVTIACRSLSLSPSFVWTRRNRMITDADTEEVVQNGTLHPNMNADDFSITTRFIDGQETSTLIIQNVSVESGLFNYYCRDDSLPSIRPMKVVLAVIGHEATCSQQPEFPLENQAVMFTCRVPYSGPWTFHPRWSSSNGKLPSSSRIEFSHMNNQVESSMNITASEGLHRVQMMFELLFRRFPINVSYQFSSLEVYLSPRNTEYLPKKRIYSTGEYVTCRSGGWPTPSIEWRDEATGSRCHGDNLLLTPEMQGERSLTCIATNTIDGSMQHDLLTFSVYVHDAGQSMVEPTQPWCSFFSQTTISTKEPPVSIKPKLSNGLEPASPVASTQSEPPFNVTAVVAPIVATVIVAIIVFVVVMQKKKKSRNNFADGLGRPTDFGNDDTGVYLHGTAQPNQYLYGRQYTGNQGARAEENLEYMHIDDIDVIKQSMALERQCSGKSQDYLCPVN